MIEPAAGIATHHFAPVWIQHPSSAEGEDARKCYDLLVALFRRYEYLKESGGRPNEEDSSQSEAMPSFLAEGLRSRGWDYDPDKPVIADFWFSVEPWFTEHVIFTWNSGSGRLLAYVCDWTGDLPYWAAGHDTELMGENLLLVEHFDAHRDITAEQIHAAASSLAQKAVSLIRHHVPISEHQVTYRAPESDPQSPEGQLLPVLASATAVGIWGLQQTPEDCFRELVRLDPRVLNAFVMPVGVAFSEDGSLAWMALTNQNGSAVFGFQFDDESDADLIQFGGIDVQPPFQLAMIGRGRTHGALNSVLQDCRIVPMESMPGMALHVSEELAAGLLALGWEKVPDDDNTYFIRDRQPVFLTTWNENHFGLFTAALSTTEETEMYRLQEAFGFNSLVRTIGRNDPLLRADTLTVAATDLLNQI
ncbi:MAG: hypothetical protein KDC26_12995 [Armatimonadetes bacterium]|nr:hypothetical protein [Armatimonadota bacterium]